jgi:Glycosyl hydrolase family 99
MHVDSVRRECTIDSVTRQCAVDRVRGRCTLTVSGVNAPSIEHPVCGFSTGRTADSVREDVAYLVDAFGDSSALLRIGRRPVFYVYDSYHIDSSDWARLFRKDSTATVRGTPLDGAMTLSLQVSPVSVRCHCHCQGHATGRYD